MLERLSLQGFELTCLSHAEAILSRDFPDAVTQIESVLENFSIPITEIIGSGGGEAIGTQRLRKALYDLGWQKSKFEIKKIINGIERESITHEIDHVKVFPVNGHSCSIALEIEWNNKDPFFDRDLENFKRLHAEGAISLGVIITRGSLLQDSLLSLVRRFAAVCNVLSFDELVPFDVNPTNRQREKVDAGVRRGKTFEESWAEVFVSDKFGAATTHWRKLMDRVSRGVGNPCPLLLIGLPVGIITFDELN
ncbi:MAG: hypothetical protein M0P73_00980 [Syntrophobacterales bacterium]|jgi:hypothetical protein|nr:hypothetical protein [Syntrophobacterales bacterium]